MAGSRILSIAARLLMPLLLMFSVFLLFRGHNAPGGGFVGGLVAASAFSLYAIANGVSAARAALRTEPRILAAVGLLVSLASGLPGLLAGGPFMSGVWLESPLPVVGKFGTPVLFDVGVYLVVVGIVTTMVFTLSEE